MRDEHDAAIAHLRDALATVRARRPGRARRCWCSTISPSALLLVGDASGAAAHAEQAAALASAAGNRAIAASAQLNLACAHAAAGRPAGRPRRRSSRACTTVASSSASRLLKLGALDAICRVCLARMGLPTARARCWRFAAAQPGGQRGRQPMICPRGWSRSPDGPAPRVACGPDTRSTCSRSAAAETATAYARADRAAARDPAACRSADARGRPSVRAAAAVLRNARNARGTHPCVRFALINTEDDTMRHASTAPPARRHHAGTNSFGRIARTIPAPHRAGARPRRREPPTPGLAGRQRRATQRWRRRTPHARRQRRRRAPTSSPARRPRCRHRAALQPAAR
ncbi:MAG: hypothetical protein MZW92_75995 [Comamonadaceae bacterium]|nr:hypothetical protein [Comamonadaceae bacterium]